MGFMTLIANIGQVHKEKYLLEKNKNPKEFAPLMGHFCTKTRYHIPSTHEEFISSTIVSTKILSIEFLDSIIVLTFLCSPNIDDVTHVDG